MFKYKENSIIYEYFVYGILGYYVVLGSGKIKLRKHTLQKGFVYEVTIPKSYARGLGWKDGQDLVFCPNIEKGTLTLIPI